MKTPHAARRRSLSLALLLLPALSACSGGDSVGSAPEPESVSSAPSPRRQPVPQGNGPSSPGEPVEREARGDRPPLGGPIPGLTPSELAAFQRGRAVFDRRFKPSEGLGPQYNATSCRSCHSVPVSGGSAQLYRNFYVGMTSFLTPLGNLESLVVPSYNRGQTFSLEKARFRMPAPSPSINVAQRNPIPMLGTGLFEFISDATIIANTDPDDADEDGISGRYNTQLFMGIGRFGVKAQSNNVEIFTRTPLKTQMGITSDAFLGTSGSVSLALRAAQATTSPNDPTLDNDGVPDPEISRQDLGDLIAFTRFLAPPQKIQPFTSAARAGEQHFDAIGCAKCHIPTLPSSRGPVEAYTDLLLHDLGPALADGIPLGSPQFGQTTPFDTGGEFRTQPLWGVSLHGPFLHDGRAETLREAIEMHAGEAQASVDGFTNLGPQGQAEVIEFLEHL